MIQQPPNLLTLLRWAECLAAGEECADWTVWCASSPDAAWKWERITAAQDLLASGRVTKVSEAEIAAERLAQFLAGDLPASASGQYEQSCWESADLLAETLSAVKFERQPLTETGAGLERRLFALGPKRVNGHAVHKEMVEAAASPNVTAND